MLRKSLLLLVALLALLLTLAFVSLRDNPARSALGERRVTRSGEAKIHYFASGDAAAPAVALLPSYARSASDFNELAAELNGAGYRTLAMQPRGIDGSTLPSWQMTLHGYAEDLRAVLDAEAITEPVAVVGHAYGNRVARTFASDFPDSTQALVLLAAGGAEPAAPEVTAAIPKALIGTWPEATRRRAIALGFFAEGNAVPDYWMAGWYPRAGIAQARATANTPFVEWGAGGRAPILILQPAEDAAAPSGAAALAKRFPDRVELVVIEGAGHALLPEQPAEVAREILLYLARQGLRS
jgi:pimeloyl-ACP methyl ester carboxylesterase